MKFDKESKSDFFFFFVGGGGGGGGGGGVAAGWACSETKNSLPDWRGLGGCQQLR